MFFILDFEALLLSLVSLWFGLSSVSISLAETPGPGGGNGEKIRVSLLALATEAEGATVVRAAPFADLAVGQRTVLFFNAGGFDAEKHPERALCIGSDGAGSDGPPTVLSAVHSWRAAVQVVAARIGQIELLIDWSRTSSNGKGKAEKVGDRRRITIEEGRSHTLDFLAKEDDSNDSCGLNLRVDLKAEVVENPQQAAKELVFDLWFIDEAPGGVKQSQTLTMTLIQGQRGPFRFQPLTWVLPVSNSPRHRGATAAARLEGAIQGRLRRDGSVALNLEVLRTLGFKQIPGPVDGTSKGGKEFVIRPGETVDLALPSPQGTLVAWEKTDSKGRTALQISLFGARQMNAAPHDPNEPTNGVAADAERLLVNFGKFLAGHQMSLRIAVRPAT